METGEYYLANQKKIEGLTDGDWEVALAKCKQHLQWRLKQKTLSGAHSPPNLGADPIDYYLGIAYEKILSGDWEWKDGRSLSDQMIRIVNSEISKSVERAKSAKGNALKIEYKDNEEEFYDLASPADDEQEQQEAEQRLKDVEAAAAGDDQLEFMIECLKEGKKRSEIADLLEIDVKQFDKLREKLMKRARNQKQSSTR